MTIRTSLQLFTIKDELEADLEGSLAAVAAAPALELAIVEFDHYEGDLFDAIERSRVYLDEKVAG